MEKSKRVKQSMGIVCLLCILSILLMIHPAWSADTGKTEISIDTKAGQSINLIVNRLGKFKSKSVIKELISLTLR